MNTLTPRKTAKLIDHAHHGGSKSLRDHLEALHQHTIGIGFQNYAVKLMHEASVGLLQLRVVLQRILLQDTQIFHLKLESVFRSLTTPSYSSG